MKIIIIIPAFNEEACISQVVENIKNNYTDYDYVIINDGSKDKTSEICHKNGYNIVDQPINLGLTGAFQTGMKYAYENNYDCAIQIDADGQHDPCFIKQLLEVMENTQANIVIGSRFVSEKKPFSVRMIGSRLISGAIKFTTGKHIGDPTSGMRLYDKSLIEKFAHGVNYSPEPDTISYFLRCGYKVEETQVDMKERIAGSSYLTLLKSIKYMTLMAVSIIFIQFFRKRG